MDYYIVCFVCGGDVVFSKEERRAREIECPYCGYLNNLEAVLEREI